MESLGPWQNSGSVFGTFGHHHDDQEAQECPQNGDLEDFGCLDEDFFTLFIHMIPFWNPYNHGKTQEEYLDHLVTISMIRKLRNILEMVILRILGVLMGILSL